MRKMILALIAFIGLGATALGDPCTCTVQATGGTTSTGLPARFGHILNVIDDFGAVADASGGAGVGTDNTAAFQAAMGVAKSAIVIPTGQYRFTGTVNIANGVQITCQGRESTQLWFDDSTGTKDAFTVNGGTGSSATVTQVSFKNCSIGRTSVATAGALIHATNTYLLHIEGNFIGLLSQNRSFDNIKVDCTANAQMINAIYFLNNYITGAVHDDVNLSCPVTTNSMADIFFENRNYFSNSQHAAVELTGSVGLAHFDAADFDNNSGTAILGTSAGGATGTAALVTVHGSHFEGNGDDVNLTGYTLPVFTGNEFITKGGITCTSCSQGVSTGNNYSDNTGLTLSGVGGWTESGSHWSTTNSSRAGMVTVSPSGTTASSSISIAGGDFPFTYVPFLKFGGSANPATNVHLSVNAGQGACWSGSNFVSTSFTYACESTLGSASASNVIPGDLGVTASGHGVLGNLYYNSGWKYYANGGAGAVQFGTGSGHSVDFIYAPDNSSGSNAAASEAVGGFVVNDGSLQWGTSTPCGSGCGNFGKLRANAMNLYGNFFPQQMTVASLPTCNGTTTGSLVVVTDFSGTPTYNASLVGGGTSITPAFCNGSAWKVH